MKVLNKIIFILISFIFALFFISSSLLRNEVFNKKEFYDEINFRNDTRYINNWSIYQTQVFDSEGNYDPEFVYRQNSQLNYWDSSNDPSRDTFDISFDYESDSTNLFKDIIEGTQFFDDPTYWDSVDSENPYLQGVRHNDVFSNWRSTTRNEDIYSEFNFKDLIIVHDYEPGTQNHNVIDGSGTEILGYDYQNNILDYDTGEWLFDENEPILITYGSHLSSYRASYQELITPNNMFLIYEYPILDDSGGSHYDAINYEFKNSDDLEFYMNGPNYKQQGIDINILNATLNFDEFIDLDTSGKEISSSESNPITIDITDEFKFYYEAGVANEVSPYYNFFDIKINNISDYLASNTKYINPYISLEYEISVPSRNIDTQIQKIDLPDLSTYSSDIYNKTGENLPTNDLVIFEDSIYYFNSISESFFDYEDYSYDLWITNPGETKSDEPTYTGYYDESLAKFVHPGVDVIESSEILSNFDGLLLSESDLNSMQIDEIFYSGLNYSPTDSTIYSYGKIDNLAPGTKVEMKWYPDGRDSLQNDPKGSGVKYLQNPGLWFDAKTYNTLDGSFLTSPINNDSFKFELNVSVNEPSNGYDTSYSIDSGVHNDEMNYDDSLIVETKVLNKFRTGLEFIPENVELFDYVDENGNVQKFDSEVKIVYDSENSNPDSNLYSYEILGLDDKKTYENIRIKLRSIDGPIIVGSHYYVSWVWLWILIGLIIFLIILAIVIYLVIKIVSKNKEKSSRLKFTKTMRKF